MFLPRVSRSFFPLRRLRSMLLVFIDAVAVKLSDKPPKSLSKSGSLNRVASDVMALGITDVEFSSSCSRSVSLLRPMYITALFLKPSAFVFSVLLKNSLRVLWKQQCRTTSITIRIQPMRRTMTTMRVLTIVYGSTATSTVGIVQQAIARRMHDIENPNQLSKRFL